MNSRGYLPPIKAAAILTDGGPVYLPRPARHHDIIRALVEMGAAPPIARDRYEQGFILEDGMFVRRKPAIGIASYHYQLMREPTGGILTSEDLW